MPIALHPIPRRLALPGLLLLVSCSDQGAALAPAKPSAAPVEVATAAEKAVPVVITAVGKVEAYSTVMVKSRVEGHLESVKFREGEEVKVDQVLFQIDPRPFEAALKIAEANLARDVAMSDNARLEAERVGRLQASDLASRDELDVARSRAESLEATVRADRAQVENARLQLGYSTIRSTLDGRTGDLKVHEGNLVKAEDDVLVVINQVAPIYAGFSIPEDHLPALRRHLAEDALKVEARAPGDEENPVIGKLTFVDNAVDSETGTIRLKATFTNEGRRLWPGLYVNVSLILAVEPRAVVIPSQAVQTGQQGQYVFVVARDSTVEMRPLVAGRTLDGETVVQSGVQPGEVVVTDGQLRLVPGARVEVKNSPPAAADAGR